MLRYIVHKYISENVNKNTFKIVKRCAFQNCKYSNYNIVTDKMINYCIHEKKCVSICEKCKTLITKD